MIGVLQTITLIFVVLAMVPALAHALELPGKLRLTKDAYVAVQPIYYPGFTIVGIAEPVAIISAIVLLFLMPSSGKDFFAWGSASKPDRQREAVRWTGPTCATVGSIRTSHERDLRA